MIRLGYARCTACHLTPQGGGLLTDYDKGVDEAQSLRRGEYRAPKEARAQRADLRLLTAASLLSATPSGGRPSPSPWLRVNVRTSAMLGRRMRLASTVLFGAPPGELARLWEQPDTDLTAAWEYRPSNGVVLSLARDRLPRGVELGSTRTILDEADDADRFPTQLSVIAASTRFQITAYVYGPGSQAAIDRRARGAGAIGGIQLFKDHLVVGPSIRRALSEVEQSWALGGYARFGVGPWGVLTEHQRLSRDVTAAGEPSAPRRYSSYTQLFVAPKEWLVASLIGEHASQAGGWGDTFRWRPEIQARLTSHVTISASTRIEVVPSTLETARVYLIQAALKTVQ
jgi:hypothetical protein